MMPALSWKEVIVWGASSVALLWLVVAAACSFAGAFTPPRHDAHRTDEVGRNAPLGRARARAIR